MSVAEPAGSIEAGAVDLAMPDAPRIAGITPYLRVAAMAEYARVRMAPHCVMKLDIQMVAVYPAETWVEHIE